MTQQAGGVDPDDDAVVVIGGGPAGLTAATWLRRYRRSALALDGEQHLNRWVERVHGVLASDPVSPQALLQQVQTNLERYGSVRLTPAPWRRQLLSDRAVPGRAR
jgi:thioredoxin reductase